MPQFNFYIKRGKNYRDTGNHKNYYFLRCINDMEIISFSSNDSYGVMLTRSRLIIFKGGNEIVKYSV